MEEIRSAAADQEEERRKSKLRSAALVAAISMSAQSHFPATSWEGNKQARPEAGAKKRRAKAKATRKAKQAQRRKNR